MEQLTTPSKSNILQYVFAEKIQTGIPKYIFTLEMMV